MNRADENTALVRELARTKQRLAVALEAAAKLEAQLRRSADTKRQMALAYPDMAEMFVHGAEADDRRAERLRLSFGMDAR